LLASKGNPSTPTLVVVGEGKSEVERSWGGVTTANSPALSGTGSQEIRVGLAIGSMSPREKGNRKSERVVVESVVSS